MLRLVVMREVLMSHFLGNPSQVYSPELIGDVKRDMIDPDVVMQICEDRYLCNYLGLPYDNPILAESILSMVGHLDYR